jgi:hypothetical protein
MIRITRNEMNDMFSIYDKDCWKAGFTRAEMGELLGKIPEALRPTGKPIGKDLVGSELIAFLESKLKGAK